jgi:hypothetical protein
LSRYPLPLTDREEIRSGCLSDFFARDIRGKFRRDPLTAYIHEKRANSFLPKLFPEILIFFPLRIEGSYEEYCFHRGIGSNGRPGWIHTPK